MGQFSKALYAHREKYVALLNEMDRMRKTFNESMNECWESIDVLQEVAKQDTEICVRKLEPLTKQIQHHLKDQDNIITLVKQELASGLITTTTMKIWRKYPKLFDETRDAKMLGNFYWDVEQYLD